MHFRSLLIVGLLVACCGGANAVTPEGLVYESEKIAQPQSAWIQDRGTPDHWTLWTKEQDIEKKRSGGAVLASPPVTADRNSPAEGAPPLHCVVSDLQPGWYQVYVSAPGRPLGYSLDGKDWFRHQGGELELGPFLAGQRPFELWVDDRYGHSGDRGPAYFDYVRFVPTAEPGIADLETVSPEPGTLIVAWTTKVPMSGGRVTLRGGAAPQQSPEETESLRNHRAVFRGLDAGKDYAVSIDYRARLAQFSTPPRPVRAAPPTVESRRDLAIPLTVAEPTPQPRRQWPTTIGMPFAKGALSDARLLQLKSADDQPLPLQAETFARWPDGSVKWATLHFLANSGSDGATTARLTLAAQPVVAPGVVRVESSAAGWTLFGPKIALRIDRQQGPLFSDLQRTAGTGAASTAKTGADARLTLVDGDGKRWVCGPPDADGVQLETSGPVRATVKWSGPLAAEAADDKAAAQAAGQWGYQARLTFWQGQPLVDLDISLWREALEPTFVEVRSWTLRVPRPAGGKAETATAQPAALPWAIQDHDNRCRYGDGGSPGESVKERGDGFVALSGSGSPLAVALPDFWQNYPYGYRAAPQGVDLLLLPELPADIYHDADGQKWYWRIYSWCREGKYVFRSGQLLRRRVRLWLGPVDDPQKLAAWLQQPLLPQAAPEYLCATGLLGLRLAPQSAGHWADYERWFQRAFAALEADGRQNRTFGWAHYGDWYGERVLNYGNNEYDLPWALAVQWMRTGNADYFWRGQAMARHYSSIDSVHGQAAARARGLVFEHSFNHVGTPLSLEELQFPTKNARAQQYLEQYGKGMFRGAIDPQGHVFEEGNWFAAALSGDRFLRDEAARVCDHQAMYLTRKFDFGIERAGGWPLINAVGAYRHSGDPFYLNAARLMIERCLERQDPATGGWLHKPPLSETDNEPVMGGKAFAVGILSFGILRYLEVEPRDRPDVRTMVVRGADWLMNESWNPEKKGFRYISNCAKYRNTGDRGLTALMTLELVATAYDFTHDEKYRRFAHELLVDDFTRDFGGMGKGFAQGTRQTIFGLERLRQAEAKQPKSGP